mgnify:CR=1 FL=1
MRTARAAALALLLAGLAAAGPAAAYFEETALGSRGVALGFSALASIRDVTAAYWNPAGLADLDGTQAFADYCKPHGVPDLNEGAVLAGTRRWDTGWALGWHRLGIAGAYGLALCAHTIEARTRSSFLKELRRMAEALASTRPSAVNLRWAIDRTLAAKSLPLPSNSTRASPGCTRRFTAR